MLCVILNWAKRMITCAARIKRSLHVELQGQTDRADSTDLLLRSFGGNNAPPYILHSKASCQLHLYGWAVLNFPYGCSWAVALCFVWWQWASHRLSLCTLIIYCSTGLFVLTLWMRYALVELFLSFLKVNHWYPKGSTVSTQFQAFSVSHFLQTHVFFFFL